jgi:hypothetical protein
MHIMLGKDLEMPLRSRNKLDMVYNDYRQAMGFLEHDLVWSQDFEAIRLDLAKLIRIHAADGDYPAELTAIVQKLIATENDISI